MPVYLCQSGAGEAEPWRFGIQVYSAPFDVNDASPQPGQGGGRDLVVASWTPGQPETASEHRVAPGHPIRRIRHAETVLVDDVCISHGRYWLRLRWPGHKGGFSGYVAMQKVSEVDKEGGFLRVDSSVEERTGPEEAEDERQETGSMPPSEPFDDTPSTTLTCLRTGLNFQSSNAMKLLAVYDDGISPPVALTPFNPEPVFCRICREGLHDDADEEQPSPAAEEDDGGGIDPSAHGDDNAMTAADRSGTLSDDDEQILKGPVQPHPVYSTNAEALQNPLLAPCECSGSMAFVHYLCVEEWRCRSRHPEARHGLNCETCGKPYTLPPPSERPAPTHFEQEDWLDAMPPHVMQALRQPHIWWRIGAGVVRRRWLRPLAPVLMSPVVALYCRARRLLKKRGVARRRWACSLCRRRARWKCVRCLRSYYCSRQCQNVSWHIVHKHVCYKPARFWWSVFVYGAMTIALFPGILRDPLMYDLGFCLIPASFIVMGVIGGGFAMVMKKAGGFDIRGRMLEFAVVLCTLYLSVVSWGLVKGFFGDSSQCLGAFGSVDVPQADLVYWSMLRNFRKLVLQPVRSYYVFLDSIPTRFGYTWLQSALCTNNDKPGCFEHLPNADPDFFFSESGGQRCAADLLAIGWLYAFAAFTFVASAGWKHHDRQRRRHGRRPVRGEAHPHED